MENVYILGYMTDILCMRACLASYTFHAKCNASVCKVTYFLLFDGVGTRLDSRAQSWQSESAKYCGKKNEGAVLGHERHRIQAEKWKA